MNDQAKVGLMVLISGIILVATVLYMTGVGVHGRYVQYKISLKYVGGLEQGAPVRFGGLKVGRVQRLEISAQDPSVINVSIEVKRDTPIRSDSNASIAQLSLLGENYIEIQPGKSPTVLPPGSTIPTTETQDLTALMKKMNALMEQAQPLVADLHRNLNQISGQVDALLTDLRDVTGTTNRAHLANMLKNTDQMLASTGPKMDAITTNFQNASVQLEPLMNDLRATSAKVDKLMSELNGVVGENRKELQTAIAGLSKTLESTRELVSQLNDNLAYNSGNIDATLVNIRETTQNLKEFSDTLRQRPFSLIRVIPKPDRPVPGGSENRQGKRGRVPAGSGN